MNRVDPNANKTKRGIEDVLCSQCGGDADSGTPGKVRKLEHPAGQVQLVEQKLYKVNDNKSTNSEKSSSKDDPEKGNTTYFTTKEAANAFATAQLQGQKVKYSKDGLAVIRQT